ncbi:APC family permease [Ornithinimicrobium cerasi]|uniref:Amino acid/polyamine/organocation transporter, APC superfamily n=1 Tax=Ornithinimicrobium cerasi TaxID=2248773 RepID=A0A285VJW3_9MICO|nr:APC family permease [Ornithinimicrobium cerasi]SOC54359.1 amino acid/polyamine/organocation transporter, APC superfamily [Ornithinimicrobium cerasi]
MAPGGLRRTLGLSDAVTIGLGAMVGAGVFAVWAPAARAAGGLVLPALALAALVAVCNALSSAALAARHPSAGGTYVYGRERLGPFWGYLAGWCFVVGKTASCAAMAMTLGSYLVPGSARLAAVVAVLAVTALNLLGVHRSVRASRVIVSVVGAALLGVAVAALVPRDGRTPWDAALVLGGGPGEPVGTVLGTGGVALGVLQAAGLLFFAFAGYARIATLGEEVEDPERVIPRAVVIALSVVLGLYLLVGLVVLGVLGADGTAVSSAPVADVAALVWGADLAWVVRVLAGVAALGALLNLQLGISRTSLAMARDGHLPRTLATVSGSSAVPRAAELTVGVVVLVVVLVADLRGAIGFSSFGVLLYYAVANAAALTLRREWAPGGVVPVVGLTGCLVLAATLPTSSVLGGTLLVGAGAVGYAVRARLGGV